jgi:hypothetical protein
VTRPAPPPHVLLRTSGDGGAVWQHTGNDVWWNRVGRWSATWAEIDAGGYGDVELLVPVPYATPEPGQPGALLAQQAVEGLLNPAGAMAAELAAAFAAGITATIADAYRTGRLDERLDQNREASHG